MKHTVPAKCRRDFCPAVDSADVISVRYQLPFALLFWFGHFVINIRSTSVVVVYCYRASSPVANEGFLSISFFWPVNFSYVGVPWDKKNYLWGFSIEKKSLETLKCIM
jgi:hypothetical protein